jgi:hypothetical protein
MTLAVDIVITNHDYGEFVADAVESACAQSHPDVNVVVVDDGSTDDSRERLRQYEDRVEVVLKEQGGQASAFNAGMERCRGDVVIFLDSDDMLRPEAAARAAAAFAADPDLAKVQLRMAVVDADGRATGVVKPGGYLQARTGDLTVAEMAFPFDIPWLPTSGNAFRSAPLRRILPVPEADYPRCGADWYVAHLTPLLGTVAFVDEVSAEYRVHGRNGYEQLEPSLDLRHVRDTITFAGVTTAALSQLADRLGIERPARILSVSDLGNRLISLRLEPELHPIAGDRIGRLMADGLRASSRRFDVTWPMKLLLGGWLAAMAFAPRSLARRLAELFLFPERRPSWQNGVLGRLRR